MIKTALYCPICETNVHLEEEVNLDIFNRVTHQYCKSDRLPMKDSGTFEEMVNKYSFFNSVLDNKIGASIPTKN